MADIQDIRAQLREIRHQPAARSIEGGGNTAFYLLAGLAVAVGFGVVLFMPKIFSVQRTASLPVFHESAPRDAGMPAHNGAAPAMTPVTMSGYAGKGVDEVASIADAVCARAATRPASAATQNNNGDTVTHENEKLSCFLTEGLPRFCAPGQSRKATADVINYFKGIEYANAAAAIASKFTGSPPRLPGVEGAPPGARLVPDPRVIVAAEGLIKAGYLSRAQRDEIGANVPPDIRHRYAIIVPNASPCPKPPWWAIWK